MDQTGFGAGLAPAVEPLDDGAQLRLQPSQLLRADSRTAVEMTTVDMPDKTRPVPAPYSRRIGLPSGDSVSTAPGRP